MKRFVVALLIVSGWLAPLACNPLEGRFPSCDNDAECKALDEELPHCSNLRCVACAIDSHCEPGSVCNRKTNACQDLR